MDISTSPPALTANSTPTPPPSPKPILPHPLTHATVDAITTHHLQTLLTTTPPSPTTLATAYHNYATRLAPPTLSTNPELILTLLHSTLTTPPKPLPAAILTPLTACLTSWRTTLTVGDAVDANDGASMDPNLSHIHKWFVAKVRSGTERRASV